MKHCVLAAHSSIAKSSMAGKRGLYPGNLWAKVVVKVVAVVIDAGEGELVKRCILQ